MQEWDSYTDPRRLLIAFFVLISSILWGGTALAGEGPYGSTYRPRPAGPIAIVDASVITGAGGSFLKASLLAEDGRITAIGPAIAIPEGAKVIDARGKWLTPGIIDMHSHHGVVPLFAHASLRDHNESTHAVRADVWAEHSLWPGDPSFARSLAAGVTTLHILPGSHNLIGGRGVTVKNVLARTVPEMKFPGAPHSLKMACGENPKRVHGNQGGPRTRMGNMAGFRKAWLAARDYKNRWDRYRRGESPAAPGRDLGLETLAGVLGGEILVHIHCHRADELVNMINLSHEFGYRIAAFHHAVESYKVPEYLEKDGICAAIWADWWGFSLEALDGIDESAAFLAAAGACVVIHSDSISAGQRLNQEMAKAWSYGRRLGIEISKAEAFSWITLNAAKAIGIADRTGSLEVGKMADLVIWSGDPFSTYSLAEQVYIDGALMYDRADPETHGQSDFELGYSKKGAHQ